jgi:hypothetical protein
VPKGTAASASAVQPRASAALGRDLRSPGAATSSTEESSGTAAAATEGRPTSPTPPPKAASSRRALPSTPSRRSTRHGVGADSSEATDEDSL